MIEIINKHRSIRKFKDKNIEKDLLFKILESGTRASTTGNMQVYSIIINSEKSVKEKLWEVHFKQNMVLQAPILTGLTNGVNKEKQFPGMITSYLFLLQRLMHCWLHKI